MLSSSLTGKQPVIICRLLYARDWIFWVELNSKASYFQHEWEALEQLITCAWILWEIITEWHFSTSVSFISSFPKVHRKFRALLSCLKLEIRIKFARYSNLGLNWTYDILRVFFILSQWMQRRICDSIMGSILWISAGLLSVQTGLELAAWIWMDCPCPSACFILFLFCTFKYEQIAFTHNPFGSYSYVPHSPLLLGVWGSLAGFLCSLLCQSISAGKIYAPK